MHHSWLFALHGTKPSEFIHLFHFAWSKSAHAFPACAVRHVVPVPAPTRHPALRTHERHTPDLPCAHTFPTRSTQDEPAFCGLASLAMVLNALAIDPRRIWKGAWRWFHEQVTCTAATLCALAPGNDTPQARLMHLQIDSALGAPTNIRCVATAQFGT